MPVPGITIAFLTQRGKLYTVNYPDGVTTSIETLSFKDVDRKILKVLDKDGDVITSFDPNDVKDIHIEKPGDLVIPGGGPMQKREFIDRALLAIISRERTSYVLEAYNEALYVWEHKEFQYQQGGF